MLILFENQQLSEKSPLLDNYEDLEDLYWDYGRTIVEKSLKISEKTGISLEKCLKNGSFSSCIENFRRISLSRSPIHKLKVIIGTAVLLMDNIRSFYWKNGAVFTGFIDSDEIMVIFIYIMAKARVKGLYAQCCLIESFMGNRLSNSISGYYLITVKACLKCMAGEDFFKEVFR